MLQAILLSALALGGAPPDPGGGPGADPYPGSTAPVTYHAYDYRLPAIDKKTGKPIPGFYFQCHCSKQGKHTCKLRRR